MHSAFPQPLQYSRNPVRRQEETPVFIGFLKSLYILKARGNGRPPVAFLLHSCCVCPAIFRERSPGPAEERGRKRMQDARIPNGALRALSLQPSFPSSTLLPFLLPSRVLPFVSSFHYVPQISHETPINKGRNGNFSASDFAGVAGSRGGRRGVSRNVPRLPLIAAHRSPILTAKQANRRRK